MSRDVDLTAYQAATPFEKNGLVFDWLRSETARHKLYEKIIKEHKGVLKVPSCAPPPRQRPARTPSPGDSTAPSVQQDRSEIMLVADPALIAYIMENKNEAFCNSPYAELGSGNFLLALDPWEPGVADMRKEQKAALQLALPRDPGLIGKLCQHAVKAAAVMSLASADFDLAEFAADTGVRFCSAMFGYRLDDYVTLRESLQAAYEALTYQILGRHFVSKPFELQKGNEGLGAMLDSTSQLLDSYRRAERFPDGVDKLPDVPGFEPALRILARNTLGLMSSAELATLAVGAMVGTVGNIQAAVCTAVRHLMVKFDGKGEKPKRLLCDLDSDDLEIEIATALRGDPPAAFLPRYCRKDDETTQIKKGQAVVLALGGMAVVEPGECPEANEMVFGLAGEKPTGMHACLGKHLGWPLTKCLVDYVVKLPGLTQSLDPLTGRVKGITKTWGFRCESYPLGYRRSARRAQQTLNVAMAIKSPISENAEGLRLAISAAAPRIDDVLRGARHVHFAWFEFTDDDSHLVLHTVYDGDFNAYIQYFALEAGELFNTLFEFIADAPPLPVEKFPDEFIALIAAVNQPPAGNYLFSAYPRSEAATIMRAEGGSRRP